MAAPPVKSGYVANGPDLQLNYLEWGDPSAPVVVLLHGLLGVAYNFRTTAEALQDRYRVISLNVRGHGDSGPSPERAYNFDLWATDVHALVSALELDRPVLIGHSMGGRIAYVTAARYPDDTRGIVVVDNGPGFPVAAAERVRTIFMGQRPMEYDSWEDAIAWLGQRSRAREQPLPEAIVRARVPYHFRKLPSGKVTWKFDPLLRDEWLGAEPPARARLDSWLWHEIAQVRCPMLLMKAKTTDLLTRETCEQMVALTVGEARWVEVAGTTHRIMDDDLPAFLAEVEPFVVEAYGR